MVRDNREPKFGTIRRSCARFFGITKGCQIMETQTLKISDIRPYENNPRIALGIDNLQSLCWSCHNKETIGVSDLPSGYVFDDDGNVVPR